MSAEDIGKAQAGARIAGMLPYLAKELGGMEAAVVARVFQDLETGVLTPEKAIQAWIEVRQLRKLLKRLETHIKIGQTAGQRAKPELEG